jgi:hypothetical protein
MRTAAPPRKKERPASSPVSGTLASTPETSQLVALEERANLNPQVQRTAEIGEQLNSAPVQRTRDEALNAMRNAYTYNSEDLLRRISDTNLLDNYRLGLIRTNNRGLTEEHPDYIRIDPRWFPDLAPEQLEGGDQERSSSLKRPSLDNRAIPEKKRLKADNEEDSDEEDSQDTEGHDQLEDEAEDFEADEASSRMGVVTWNVAHFSNRDVNSVLASFEEGFQEFSSGEWSGFFSLLGSSLSELYDVVAAFEGWSEYDLRQYDLFTGLQSPDAKVEQTLKTIREIREALQEFDYSAVGARLVEVSSRDWGEEFREARTDPAARPALADSVKSLKDFERHSKSATSLFKSVQSLKGHRGLLERINRQKTGELFKALSSNRKAFPQVGLVLELRRALHSFNILTHIEEMFEDNDWLDAMILQEVNDPALLEEEGSGFEVFKGPHLVSGGENPQNEYYPLLLRENSGARVKIFTVDTRGQMEQVANNQKVKWDKGNGDYRPIVVYEIQKSEEGKPVWIGVVHTTPESDQSGGVAEFHRKEIYKEVEAGLEKLQTKAARKGIPLIIGGDFYLTSEAVVKSGGNAEAAREGMEDMARPLAKVRKLKSILEYLLALEIREDADPRPQRPRGSTREQIRTERLRTRGMTTRGGTDDAATILRERIKFLDEAMKDEQVLRNFLGLTAQRQFEDLGLLVAQTVSGTNPKHDPLARWFDVQIADFFLYNEDFKSAAVGILKPTGGMIPVDTEDLRYSRYWQRFSDHFPVGGIFSLDQENLLEHEAFPRPKGSEEDARKLNLKSFAGHGLEEENITDPGIRQTLLDLMEMTRGGEGRMKQLAEKYLSELLWELGGPESMPGIDEYVQAIQELEEQESLPAEDRLFVVSPTDFEPQDEV